MFQKAREIFAIPELRQKILLTLGLLAVYRVGFFIALPIVDTEALKSVFGGGGGQLGDLLNAVALFSASQLDQATIFGLGIMPYISASIIFQILATVWPPLEQLQKEGESGRKKINEYTRYATVVLCILQSTAYVAFLSNRGLVQANFLNENGALGLGWQFFAVMTMTAGTVFLMWLGEQIDEFGIGNGISLLIMAGILAQAPGAVMELRDNMVLQLGGADGKLGIERLIVLAVTFVAVVMGVVFITEGQRRIAIQSAKHVRGRRVMGGAREFLPLRVNQANVMPIIFAGSLLMFPRLLLLQMENMITSDGWFSQLISFLSDTFQTGQGYLYNVVYIILIYIFCYFWTAIMFNPKDVADNLKNWGSFIPGYRPGKRTADYLEKVMARITYVGAAFLSIVAVLPTLIATSMDVSFRVASFFGGTGLLIAVSVTFDLIRKIDSHLVMRNHEGILEKS